MPRLDVSVNKVTAWPRLYPQMLVPSIRHSHERPFPLDQPQTRYYYLARNAICALADAWRLAGQEVLVPAYCHGVELDALRHSHADLRFYPVREGMQVDPDDVVSRVTARTRVVYLIHYVGFPGPVRELSAFCRERNILLIEDCALALLSRLDDRPLGSFGDAAIYCLYKTLPLPNGGAVVVNGTQPAWPTAHRRPGLPSTLAYTAAAIFREAHLGAPNGHGGAGNKTLIGRARDRVKLATAKFPIARVAGQDFEPANVDLVMSGVCHWAINRQDYPGIALRRRRNYLQLLSRLGVVADVVFPQLAPGVCPLFFPLRTRHKVALQERLLERGVETVNLWNSPVTGVCPGDYPAVDDLRNTVLELPCHQDLGEEEIDRVADAVLHLRALL